MDIWAVEFSTDRRYNVRQQLPALESSLENQNTFWNISPKEAGL
jgi:hypothetical protein